LKALNEVGGKKNGAAEPYLDVPKKPPSGEHRDKKEDLYGGVENQIRDDKKKRGCTQNSSSLRMNTIFKVPNTGEGSLLSTRAGHSPIRRRRQRGAPE